MMKRLCLAVLLTFLAGFCIAQNAKSTITLISISSPEEQIFVNYRDEFNDKGRGSFRRDSITGKLQPVIISTEHPLLLKFNKNMMQYPVYALPGDTIYIKSYSAGPIYYTFHGKREHELNFFTYLEQNACGIGYPDVYGMGKKTAEFPAKVKRFLNLYNQRISLLERATDSLKFSPTFYAYANSAIKEQYLHALLGPYWDPNHIYNQFTPDYTTMVLHSGAKDYLKNDDLVSSSSLYRTVVISYIRFLSRHALDTPEELPVSYQNALNTFQGKTKDYALFYLLKTSVDEGLPEFKEYQEGFRKECSYLPYVQYIDSLAARFDNLSFSPSLLGTTLETITGENTSWQEILEKNKGKVIYVDLWASWCGPCLVEIPHSKKLQKLLPKNNISFINISIDLDRDKWKRSIEENGLGEEDSQNYLLESQSELANFLNAPPIPRYILINRQGRAVSLDAKRPSNPTLIWEINKLF
ncbi:TlpA family protein disulfide reductase [Pontibacter diazotrophicus]|uniref:TlpA family protein disulfide reductase n=1 Tax=Pontibacter diazotrophicus TaxID=1400979 RepID=A0A3D8KZZ7_9BACT|nr:TlpA disulfide reductase family protein [Pontibacter diazotrophicus]RDV10700.1 TlpA family protein disulfide reductase [Pontibacter diazotrophicus]